MSANLVKRLLFVFLTGFLLMSSGEAFANKKSVQESIQELDERLAKIETSQEEILEGQKEIIEKLAQLKIWVRRN